MSLSLFNTLTRGVQDFVPLNPAGNKVGMYCCGPTVYDFAHIGNWRTFVFSDLVRRHLEFKGFAVTHVMNITDVEDKIIRRVRETKTTLAAFTREYETAFFADLEALNCRRPHHTPRATEFIPEIIVLIEKLIARGVAYQAPDGSVYFSIEKYRGCGCHYGQLVKLNFEAMRSGERVATDEYEKESLADFALWKARVPDDGEVFWPSPWGEGRPGWHIECSAMSMKVLGPSFDLHLGGEDLKFPHHEDEIAQSEGATGKPFVKYWLHGAHLLVEGKKMSKSLGNYFTLGDLIARGFKAREVRYLFLKAHYRETFNFTLDGLTGARTALARIKECMEKLLAIANRIPEYKNTETTALPDAAVIQAFSEALDDDLNVSKAWAVVFAWIRDLNRLVAQEKLAPEQTVLAVATWKRLDQVLGMNFELEIPASVVDETTYGQGIGMPVSQVVSVEGEQRVPEEVLILAEQQMQARRAKNFKLADEFRAKIKSLGYLVENTPTGSKLKAL